MAYPYDYNRSYNTEGYNPNIPASHYTDNTASIQSTDTDTEAHQRDTKNPYNLTDHVKVGSVLQSNMFHLTVKPSGHLPGNIVNLTDHVKASHFLFLNVL